MRFLREIVCHTARHLYTVTLQDMLQITCLISMDVVWNPTTGRVSPQYHVVFDDDFTNGPYMEAGTLPPNWQEIIEH